MRVNKPWGYEEIWAKTSNYVGKLLYIKAGHRLSKQFHQTKEETIYVVEGTLYNYDKNDNVEKFVKGTHLHISPHQVHRFSASDGDVKLIEVSRCRQN